MSELRDRGAGAFPSLQNLLGPGIDLGRILDSLAFPMGVFSPEGRVIFVNLPPLADSGQVAGDVTGKFLWETSWFSYSDESRNKIRSILESAAAGNPERQEISVKFADNTFRTFEGNFGPLRDTEGKTIAIIASGLELTSLKGSEDQLQKSQLLLEGIVEHLPVIVFLKRASDLTFSLVNRTTERLLGFPRDQLLGKSDYDFWTKQQADFFTAADREVLNSHDVKKIDREPIRTAAGETRYLRTWKVALRTPYGEPEYLMGISIDITDELSTLEALRLSEEKLRGLYELSPLGIALTSSAGNFVDYNEAFRRICGYPDEELKTLDYWKLTPSEYNDLEQVQIDSLLKTGRYGPYEKEYIQKDGTRIPIRLNGISVIGTDGHKFTWSIVEDITEQKTTEETLRQAQKLKAVGQLTAGIAHDFNNLLAVVSGNLELLLDDKGLSVRSHKLASLALSAVRRGGELTQHLLAYGRKQQLNVGVHNLGTCIENTMRWLRRTLPANIELRAAGIETAVETQIDEAQLENSLLNLSLNARDAMQGGGVLSFLLEEITSKREIPVYGARLPSGRYAKITVRDTGTGMPAEILREAFDPFFTTKKLGQGSGMGLSMVYGFVRQSGGGVAVTSEVGVGTVFELYFPMVVPAVAEPAPAPVSTPGPEKKKESARVMVVEDIAEVRETITLQVESLGHHVTAVPDGEAAVKLLYSKPFDLLITDLGLPGQISGKELCELGLALKPELRMITMSGYNEELAAPQLANLRAPHLRKPFESAELRRQIEIALST